MKAPEFENKTQSENLQNDDLLVLGDGEVGYVRHLTKDELPELPADVKLENAWGVYSAKGEAMALCDSATAAWHFGADQDLQIVSVH
jgi:hypothetical protein